MLLVLSYYYFVWAVTPLLIHSFHRLPLTESLTTVSLPQTLAQHQRQISSHPICNYLYVSVLYQNCELVHVHHLFYHLLTN